ncbi:hypothetical protein [Marinimicrobium locisalis]|uniref:hypothetical protein n=1 Tax=Marinimicrobium locisalis TaxID=546022 RepID=UPI0032218D68
MSEVTPIMLTAIILTAAGFAINIPALLMWYVLHKLLSPRLDPILLREPYFNRAEQINYRFFPLYLVKAINYIYLVAWPTMAKKRRFKGLETPLPISRGLRATCIFQVSLMIFGVLVGIIWVLFLAFA